MFGNNGLRGFAISLPKQPKCKSERMSLSLLETWLISETIIASFRGHVACHFYPLVGLQYVHVS